jgi:outer membrane protein OmpA-like peptidoglycan-associated protein
VKFSELQVAVALAASACGLAIAAEPPASSISAEAGRPVSFVTCPQFRDTARQCWLAEYDGKVYYIGAVGLGSMPQLLHRVLVEGRAHDGQTSCGAINVSPVHLSVLPEIDTGCNTVLPDNGTSPLDPSRFDAPPEVLSQTGAERPPPSPLTKDASWSIVFDFGSTFLNQLNQQLVESAAKSIVASSVAKVIITGTAASAKLDSGQVLDEDPALATNRATLVRNALVGLGVDPQVLELRTTPGLVKADGVHDWQRRSAEIEVRIRSVSR